MENPSSDSENPDDLLAKIASCMQRDRFGLRKSIRKYSTAKDLSDGALEELTGRIQASINLAEKRRSMLPVPELDSELPIYERRNEITQAIEKHQVVVISGETGSGKSTQLPLIALQMGLGVHGFIGHTQPRRIAARSVANRIAHQLGTSLGIQVGFKIRFDDKTQDTTFVKLMTDGILLAETQSDRFLDQYELIIIDEAHERSLNIDFLIGNLKRVLQKRRDLKVIITSATIDTERFAKHFSTAEQEPAPVIHVEGRTYPVEMRYCPAEETESQDDPIDHVVDSVRQAIRSEHGDMLVFLPTEKDIKTVSKKLKGPNVSGGATEILPLYARLSSDQQNSIFQPGSRRRIVLATNVAESSITVPRIRIVVDSGTARISRYAPRSKVQRLPIEPISQASANQRAGRCGRVGPGICIRLFSEEDFESRPKFTTPEIRRTNLASVILQTLALRLGDIAEFPFIDPPHADSIRDGYKTLFEIGAIDEKKKLTSIGRWLSKLPVDPRIGRILYAANEEGCLSEALIIASALEIQDPRVRPAEKQKHADEQHEKFKNEQSDFMSFLKLWDFFHQLRGDLSRSQFRKACQQNFLSLTLIHQWQEVHRQLKGIVRQQGLKSGERRDDYNAIHRALLPGLLSGIAILGDKFEYTGAGGIKFHLWPGSGIFEKRPKWIVVSEIVETTKRYGRTIAKISPEWIEPIAKHLAKYNHVDPHWSQKQQTVLAYENVSLFGLPIVNRRRKHYAKIDPELAWQIFIERGLVEFQIKTEFDFLNHNRQLIEGIEKSAAKSRRHDWIVDSKLLLQFYFDNVPSEAVDVASLQRLIKQDKRLNANLKLTDSDLGISDSALSSALFPDSVDIAGMNLNVEYRFEPGHESDGATLTIPKEALSQLNESQTPWLIPGLNESRITSMIKSLPKSLRRHFIPAPETARRVYDQLGSSESNFLVAVARELSRIAGEPITPEMFSNEKIDESLLLNIQVVDESGEQVACGRNITELRKTIGVTSDDFVKVEDTNWNADGLTSWSWGDLPEEVFVTRGRTDVKLFPTVVDQGESVGLRLVDSKQTAAQLSGLGVIRLFALNSKKSLRKQVNWLPGLDQSAMLLGSLIKSDQLKQGLQDAIARSAILDQQKSLPRTEAEFELIAKNSIESISIATQRIAKWLPRFAEEYHKSILTLEELPKKFEPAIEDMRMQIAELGNDRFLLTTPWVWLQYFPRYFQAINVRCEKLKAGGQSADDAASKNILSYWQRYVQEKQNHVSLSVYDPELEKFRWMIEEFRVSKFAQKLGTSLTVSETRLDKQLRKVKVV